MSLRFDPSVRRIVIPAELKGPSGSVLLNLILDTGASRTVVNWDVLVLLGYNPASAPKRVQITTGSGVELVPAIALEHIKALEQTRQNFLNLCHTLPPTASAGLYPFGKNESEK